MILLFGLCLLIILVSLIYLSYNNSISTNIPLVFIFFILVISPFLYLGQKAENFSNWDNTNRSSLDIFYTNTKENNNNCKGCPGICDLENNDNSQKKLQQIELIDNQIQGKFLNQSFNKVLLSVSSSLNQNPNTFSSSIKTPNSDPTINRLQTFQGGLIIQNLPINDLIKYSNNVNKNKFFRKNTKIIKDITKSVSSKLIKYINKLPSNSFILISSFGNGANGIVEGKNYNLPEIFTLSDTFKIQIQNITLNSVFISLIYKIDNNKYTLHKFESTPFNSNVGPFFIDFPILQNGTQKILSTSGVSFPKENISQLTPNYSKPYVLSSYNIISTKNNELSLSISSENNKSFVFLSPRVNDTVLYSQSPTLDYGPTSTTYLNTEQPQKWTIEPVFNDQYSDNYRIVTETKPHFYLQIENNEVTTSMIKGNSNQYWNIIDKNNKFLIKHSNSNKYLGYSDSNGYLYKDNGYVFITESDKYIWNINSSLEKKKNIPHHTSNNPLTIKLLESPTDFPNITDPMFELSNNGINLSSNGKTYWSPKYKNIWNGKWIYYGSIATYNKKSLANTDFLQINLNNNGKGTLIDPYFKYNINIQNAGSNILMGIINSGKFNGYSVYLIMIPEKLSYQNPSKSYPVKIRYLISNNKNTYNLSGKNINNLSNYSVKFDGTLLQLSNFLEISGVPVDIKLL